jgi:RNA polymerase sigma-70 factor (ECF subfamily)
MKTPKAGWRKGRDMKREQLGEAILACQETLYRVAKSLLRDDADCADALGEAIVKAFARLDTLRQDNYVKTWLVRIVINECYTILRRQQKVVALEDYMTERSAPPPEDYSDLYQAMSQLPDAIRLCVCLYYLEGYSVKETAALMDTTESAVKKRLSRARDKLRQELEPKEEHIHEK